jgi:ABC-type branched-subunit amino acid transport system substrate-binding protein
MGGTEMRRASRGIRVALCLAIAALLATAGLATTGGAAVPAADPGVTAKTITLGFIYPETGVAASISQYGLKAFQARVDRQNAQGGVNGRKIEVVARNDKSSPDNLTMAQDLVENEHVFAVVNESPFAFVTYRWLLEQGVPMIGNGVDGTYYQEKGNEDILSSTGNGNPFGDLTYDGPARLMKMVGVKKASVLAYGVATSSVASAKAFMKYAVPGLGLDPAYINTAVDFGSSDVGSPVLGIKNAGADGVYLPMAAATNVAVAQGLVQNGVNMKATIMGTGYGQDFLDSPAAKALPSSTYFTLGGKPVELHDAATKQFQADLKKYSKFTGVPDYGMYQGYILADFAIAGLEKAGNPPTHRGLIDGAHGLGEYDQAGLACQPVDVSLAGRGKIPKTSCGYFVKLVNGKFVPFPKSGQPIKAKLVGSPEALAAAESGVTATTTTAAPAAP